MRFKSDIVYEFGYGDEIPIHENMNFGSIFGIKFGPLFVTFGNLNLESLFETSRKSILDPFLSLFGPPPKIDFWDPFSETRFRNRFATFCVRISHFLKTQSRYFSCFFQLARDKFCRVPMVGLPYKKSRFRLGFFDTFLTPFFDTFGESLAGVYTFKNDPFFLTSKNGVKTRYLTKSHFLPLFWHTQKRILVDTIFCVVLTTPFFRPQKRAKKGHFQPKTGYLCFRQNRPKSSPKNTLRTPILHFCTFFAK